MADPRLVDAEPGGESTQYESIKEYTKPTPKETGQLGGDEPHTREMNALASHGQKTQRNEDIDMARKLASGSGTANVTGDADRDLKPESQDGDAAAARSRTQQGYGPGSGVGG